MVVWRLALSTARDAFVFIGAIFDHTLSEKHTCRGFRRLEYHFFVETHKLDLCSCTPRVPELSRHQHDFTSTSIPSTVFEKTFHNPRSRTLNDLPATQTQSLRAQCLARGTELRELPKSASHVSVCATKAKSLVCGLQQTKILREIVSCVDTLCGEAFVEHSLTDRTRIQHIETRGRIRTYFGIISFTQLNLFMVRVHF